MYFTLCPVQVRPLAFKAPEHHRGPARAAVLDGAALDTQLAWRGSFQEVTETTSAESLQLRYCAGASHAPRCSFLCPFQGDFTPILQMKPLSLSRVKSLAQYYTAAWLQSLSFTPSPLGDLQGSLG